MIKKINNSREAVQAFNENLEGLLTGKRKPELVKEVNNTIGRLTNVIKMELMEKALTGDRRKHKWFNMDKDQMTITMPANGQFELGGAKMISAVNSAKSKRKR